MSELDRLVGAIEEKKITESPAGAQKPWTRCSYKIGGKFFSTFDQDKMAFKVGEVVAVDFLQEGKYNNIKELALAGNAEIKTASNNSSEKDKLIIRQSCNQRAIEFVELMHKINPEALKEILSKTDGGLQALVDAQAAHFEDRVWR